MPFYGQQQLGHSRGERRQTTRHPPANPRTFYPENAPGPEYSTEYYGGTEHYGSYMNGYDTQPGYNVQAPELEEYMGPVVNTAAVGVPQYPHAADNLGAVDIPLSMGPPDMDSSYKVRFNLPPENGINTLQHNLGLLGSPPRNLKHVMQQRIGEIAALSLTAAGQQAYSNHANQVSPSFEQRNNDLEAMPPPLQVPRYSSAEEPRKRMVSYPSRSRPTMIKKPAKYVNISSAQSVANQLVTKAKNRLRESVFNFPVSKRPAQYADRPISIREKFGNSNFYAMRAATAGDANNNGESHKTRTRKSRFSNDVSYSDIDRTSRTYGSHTKREEPYNDYKSTSRSRHRRSDEAYSRPAPYNEKHTQDYQANYNGNSLSKNNYQAIESAPNLTYRSNFVVHNEQNLARVQTAVNTYIPSSTISTNQTTSLSQDDKTTRKSGKKPFSLGHILQQKELWEGPSSKPSTDTTSYQPHFTPDKYDPEFPTGAPVPTDKQRSQYTRPRPPSSTFPSPREAETINVAGVLYKIIQNSQGVPGLVKVDADSSPYVDRVHKVITPAAA